MLNNFIQSGYPRLVQVLVQVLAQAPVPVPVSLPVQTNLLVKENRIEKKL